jgi:hypothetical protein
MYGRREIHAINEQKQAGKRNTTAGDIFLRNVGLSPTYRKAVFLKYIPFIHIK